MTSEPTHDAILTLKETAELLKVAPATVRTWAANGQIPSLRAGKFWRFDRVAILEAMRHSVRPTTNVRIPPSVKASDSVEARLERLAAQGAEKAQKRKSKASS